jgi:hypothetical protein
MSDHDDMVSNQWIAGDLKVCVRTVERMQEDGRLSPPHRFGRILRSSRSQYEQDKRRARVSDAK